MRFLAPLTLVLTSLALNGCLPFAVAPQFGDFHGSWLINEQADQTLDGGIAIFAQLRLENLTQKHLKVPDAIEPVFLEAGNATWTYASQPQTSIPPGETWEGVWLMNQLLPPGVYNLRATNHELVEPSGAQLTVTDKQAPIALRTHYACRAASVSEKSGDLIQELQKYAQTGGALPSTHLQLAELLEANDQPDAARIEYEKFAEKIYGMEAIPAWLRGKIESASE